MYQHISDHEYFNYVVSIYFAYAGQDKNGFQVCVYDKDTYKSGEYVATYKLSNLPSFDTATDIGIAYIDGMNNHTTSDLTEFNLI